MLAVFITCKKDKQRKQHHSLREARKEKTREFRTQLLYYFAKSDNEAIIILVQVQSWGSAIFRCLLAGLLTPFSFLLSLLLPLCHLVAVSSFRRKAKHRIEAPLRVPRLVVPPLALMLTTRRPMHARMSSLQTGMPMYARAL